MNERCSTEDREVREWEASGRLYPRPLPGLHKSVAWNDGGCTDKDCPKHSAEGRNDG